MKKKLEYKENVDLVKGYRETCPIMSICMNT